MRIHRRLLDDPSSVVQDRSVYEDAEIFARNLYQQGLIQKRDFTTYSELYQVLTELLPPPDLVVYLRASVPTLSKRITTRDREYEREITPTYLGQLHDLYETWIADFTLCPVLTVPADDLDFVTHPHHLDLIVQKVEEKLTGKEEVHFELGEISPH